MAECGNESIAEEQISKLRWWSLASDHSIHDMTEVCILTDDAVWNVFQKSNESQNITYRLGHDDCRKNRRSTRLSYCDTKPAIHPCKMWCIILVALPGSPPSGYGRFCSWRRYIGSHPATTNRDSPRAPEQASRSLIKHTSGNHQHVSYINDLNTQDTMQQIHSRWPGVSDTLRLDFKNVPC